MWRENVVVMHFHVHNEDLWYIGVKENKFATIRTKESIRVCFRNFFKIKNYDKYLTFVSTKREIKINKLGRTT